MKHYLYLIVFCIIGAFFGSCKPEEKSKKLLFLEAIDLDSISDPARVSDILQSQHITAHDVFIFAKVCPDPQKKVKLISAICKQAPNYTSENNQNYWSSILYDLQNFVELVEFIREPHHKTFMDIGCGNGEKLYTALCLNFEKAYGLEYAPELVKMNQEYWKDFIKDDKIEVLEGDALKVDETFFTKADFVYMYSPIKDNWEMAHLFRRVLRNMRNGNMLLEVRMVYDHEIRETFIPNMPKIAGHFVVKKQNNKFFYLLHDKKNKEWIELTVNL